MADAKEGSDIIGEKISQGVNLKGRMSRELSGAGLQNEIYTRIKQSMVPYQKYFQECAQIIGEEKSRRYKEDESGVYSIAIKYSDKQGEPKIANLAFKIRHAEPFWKRLTTREKKYKCTWAKIDSLILNFNDNGQISNASFDPEIENDKTFQRATLEKSINHTQGEGDPKVDGYYLYFNDPRTMGVFVYAGGYKGRRIVDEQGKLPGAKDTFEGIVNQALHAFIPFDVSQPSHLRSYFVI